MNKRLKKVSLGYVIFNVIISFILPLIIFFIIELAFMGIEVKVLFSVSYIILNIVLAVFLGFLYYACVYSWGDMQRRSMKKTEKNLVKGLFPYTDSFYASHAFIYLNVEGGKMGVIMGSNPYEFQTIDGRRIERCWVDTRPLSKKLTRGVRFCVSIDEIIISCDTFITNSAFSMESHWTKEGIEKAEYYCDCIERLKKNAQDIADGVYDSCETESTHRTEEFDHKKRFNI